MDSQSILLQLLENFLSNGHMVHARKLLTEVSDIYRQALLDFLEKKIREQCQKGFLKDALKLAGVSGRDLTSTELEEIIRVSLFPRRIPVILQAAQMLGRSLTLTEINQVLEQCCRDWENFSAAELLIALLPAEQCWSWWEKMGEDYLRMNCIEAAIEMLVKIPESHRQGLLHKLRDKCLLNNWTDDTFKFLPYLLEGERVLVLERLLADALECWYKFDRAEQLAGLLQRKLTEPELEKVLQASINDGAYSQALQVCAYFQQLGQNRELSIQEFEATLAAAVDKNHTTIVMTMARTLPEPRRSQIIGEALDTFFASCTMYSMDNVLWVAELAEPMRSQRLLKFFERSMKNPHICSWTLPIWNLLAEPQKTEATEQLFLYYVKNHHYKEAAEMAQLLPTEMKAACAAALQVGKNA